MNQLNRTSKADERDERDRRDPRIASLDALFQARSVAVVGASSDAAKIGGKPVALLKQHFGGRIVPVNPNRSSILDLPCVPHIGSVEPPPELAIVAVPANAVEQALRDSLDAGVRSVALFTAGFGEIDAEGLAAQERFARMCAQRGARLLGPNSLGFINFHTGLYGTFSAALENVRPVPGGIGIASQSGAVGTYIMALAAEAGIGFSHFVATGNEADVDVADCIAWMAGDADTRVIVVYLEGCRDGARLKRALALAAEANKPVIAIKPGSTEAGLAAVRSHTGMLAGSKQVFDAVLRSYGAWPAASIEEAVDLAYACALGRFPRDARTGIVTPSGGVGIMLADAASEAGLALPEIPAGVQAGIKALVPLASTGNPIDTTAQVSNDFRLFGQVIDIVADGTDFPILVVFMAHMGKTPAVTELLKPSLERVAHRHPNRVIALVTRATAAFRDEMSGLGYLVFEDPNRAIRAIEGLAHFARRFGAEREEPVTMPRLADGVLDEAARSASAAARLLATLGVPELPVVAVDTEDAAARAAASLGYPVALKIDSPDIQHKTEVGGVHLALTDEASLRRAWSAMMASVRDKAPDARIAGGTVSPMLTGGIETIVGTQNDADFGPVVMFGMGGVMAEAFKDVVFRPAPVGLSAARAMIDEVRARKVFDGWRGAPPADLETLARVIAALAALAAAHPAELESVEINPFVSLPSGGAALDALVQLREVER